MQKLQAQEGLHAGNKLHERHVQWQQHKMKVNLTAQTSSASVADALSFGKKYIKPTTVSRL